MAFDVKELMIDITRMGAGQQWCHPSITTGFCYVTCPIVSCEVSRCEPSFHTTITLCKLGTYTCFAGSIVTCGGTIYCAGTEDPTLLFKGMDRKVLGEIKEQLKRALDEVKKREMEFAGESAEMPDAVPQATSSEPAEPPREKRKKK